MRVDQAMFDARSMSVVIWFADSVDQIAVYLLQPFDFVLFWMESY